MTIEVSISSAETRKAMEELAQKADNDFLGFLLASHKGVEITLQNQPFDTSRIPERLQISLTPEKARELGKFLLEATKGLE